MRHRYRNSRRVALEWTLAALSIAMLLGIDAARRRRRDPRRLSPAQLLRTLREATRWEGTAGSRSRAVLERALADSLKDVYQRRTSKSSRHRMTTTITPAKRLKPPIVSKANAKERQDAMRKWFNTAA